MGKNARMVLTHTYASNAAALYRTTVGNGSNSNASIPTIGIAAMEDVKIVPSKPPIPKTSIAISAKPGSPSQFATFFRITASAYA
ncbi:hypothetical protein GCM10019060_34080 [Novosphingobium pokkalii]|nr:hypothetical protein GCM10019060_34080 [Novosphingobium pokkalii]